VSSTEEKPVNRYTLLEQIRTEKGATQQTEILIDYIQEMWETIDLLRKVFGEERTEEIIHSPSLLSYLLDESYPYT
jgi:hypothetical protein